jgi:S1-C subfamily serine protease
VLGLLIALLAIVGCSNGHEEYFHESGFGLKSPMVAYNAEPTRLVQGTDMSRAGMMEDRAKLWERGYGVIGYSSFNGPNAESDGALAQGNKIGAAIAVFYSKFQTTRTGATTTTTPVTSTTVAPSGRTYTTTSYLSQTIPYSVDRYDFFVSYYAKVKDYGLGTFSTDPTPAEQQAFGTNKGIVVRAVRRGSSAYDAEILPGDLLLRWDGQIIPNLEASRAMFEASLGGEVSVTILRNSREITKRVMMRAG